MRYLITAIILIIIMVFEKHKYKTLLAAPVIYPVMWIISICGLLLPGDYYLVNYETLLVIILGYIVFCISFSYGNRGFQQHTISNANYSYVSFSERGLSIAFYLSLFIGAIYLYMVRQYISFTSIVDSLTTITEIKSKGLLVIPRYLTYFSGIVICTMDFFLLVYFINRDKGISSNSFTQINNRNRFLVLLFITILILLTNFSRNSLLYLLLPMLVIVAITSKTSNKKISIVAVISLSLFLIVFVWFSSFRDAYLYEGSDFWLVALSSFKLYLSGSIVALDQAWNNHTIELFSLNGGSHTFSLITSFIDKIIGTSITPDVVLDSIKIGPMQGTGTNVYTVYYWTALDFGIAYALLCQAVYGYVHGLLYRKVRVGSFSGIYWYALLTYPLIMMFFEEQYFSISQSWLLRFMSYFFLAIICGVSKYKITMNSKRL